MPPQQTMPMQQMQQKTKSKFSPVLPGLLILGLIIGGLSGFLIGSSGKSDLQTKVDSLEQSVAEQEADLELFKKYEDDIKEFEASLDTPQGQNVQVQARDVERKSDMNALATQLEIFYTDKGYYPDISGLNTETLTRVDPGALLSPDEVAIKALGTPGPTQGDHDYYYSAYNCTSGQCGSYTLLVQLEEDGSPFTEESLN